MKKLIKKIGFDEIKVIKNSGYLFLFQLLNVLIPILVLPYIIRILTVEKYGIIVFIQTIISYVILFTEYGFNINITKEISKNKDNHIKINNIFNSVFFTKLYVTIFFMFVFMLLVYLLPNIFTESFYVYIYAYIFVFGLSLSPTWIFQGFEDMKIIVYVNLVSKILFVIGLLIFIKSSEDYPFFLLLNSLSYLILGIILLYISIIKYKIKIRLINLSQVKNELKKSFHYFTSKISSTLYLNNNMLILGLFGSAETVGYYAVAEKIVRSVITLLGTLNQALLPYISRSFVISEKEGIKRSFFIMKLLFLLLFIVSLILYFMSSFIVNFLVGTENVDIISLVKIMSLIPMFGILGYFMAYIVLSNLNQMKYVPIAMIVVAGINLLLNFILVPNFAEYGAAISLLVTEGLLLVSFIYIYYLWRSKHENIYNLS